MLTIGFYQGWGNATAVGDAVEGTRCHRLAESSGRAFNFGEEIKCVARDVYESVLLFISLNLFNVTLFNQLGGCFLYFCPA
jgi:hypothetical protein